jgi:endonuclease/exonuclease/phosphatase (EEP) superfamily protein YafD
MAFLFSFITLLLFCASLTPYLPWQHMAIDLPSHFVFQYFVAAVFFLLLGWVFKAPAATQLFLCVVIAMNALQLSPLVPFPVKKEERGQAVKFLQANVLRFSEDTSKLKALIEKENPDIIVLAEVTGIFGGMMEDIKKEYPHQKVIAKDNSSFGMAVASRLPMTDTEASYYGRDDIPSISFKIAVNNKTVDIVSLHPANPVKDLKARDKDFAGTVQKFSRKPEHLVVLGDFNATPYCYTLRQFMKDLSLKTARDGVGMLGTYPSAWPFFMRLPIDHFMASDGIAIREHRLGSGVNSDHLPLVTVILL